MPESHRLHFTDVIGVTEQEDGDVTTLTDVVVTTCQHMYVTLTKTAYRVTAQIASVQKLRQNDAINENRVM